MKKPIGRFLIVAVVMLCMMGALIYRLGTLTIAEGQTWLEEASGRKVRSIAVKGERGRILDRNGVVLAYSETCYNVEFLRDADNRTDYDSAVYTESLIKAIEIIERSGGTTIDTSYLAMDENGEIVYDWGVTSDSAIRARFKNFCEAVGLNIQRRDPNYKDYPNDSSKWDLSKWPTAEYAYNYLRRAWFIPEEYTFEQANKIISIRQEVSLNNYRAYTPITIAYDVDFEVVAEIKQHSDELVGVQVSQSTTRIYPRGETAAHILGYLSRTVDTVSVDTLLAKGYTEEELEPLYKYETTTDDDGNTVPLLDENGDIVYVYDEDGNHVIDMTASSGLAYSYSDYIGVSGIESSMEAYLTGATKEHQGVREVEINKNGSIIRELSQTSATNGSDVMLTIDIEFQAVCETALKNIIEKLSADEMDHMLQDIADNEAEGKVSEYADKLDSIETAKTGAIVAMDPRTGDVLALASYPGFDPNWFVQGLSEEQAAYLNDEETTPLRNKAISAKYTPGSIFKMVTGVAGVAEDVVEIEELVNDRGDGGYYYIYTTDEDGKESVLKTNAPRCWDWQSGHVDHVNLTLTQALAQSCNYYFCELAYRMGIDTLNEWAGYFGLTSSTGIELPGEATGICGGQQVLFDNTLTNSDGVLSISGQKTSLPSLVYRRLCTLLRECMDQRMMEIDEDAVSACALRLMQIQDGMGLDGKGPEIRRIISEEIGIPEGYTQTQNWTSEIVSLLNEIQWKPTQTIRAGFGQGVSLVTPVAVARYISAIANEGTVYEAHIVDKIVDQEGDVVKEVEPVVVNEIGDDSAEWDAIWDAIKAGMQGVVSLEDRGTAAKKFSDEFTELYLDRLTGKTGTAQIGIASIDIENTAWFVTYTPREDPELVLVICVPNGYSGSWTIPAAEEIYTWYFNKQDSAAPETLAAVDGIVP